MQNIQDLLVALRSSPRILSEFVRSIPEGKLNMRRGEGFWTLAEHVNHLAQTQPMLLKRIERFMNEDHPEFVPYFPGKGEEEYDPSSLKDTAESLQQFKKFRGKQLELLEKADEATWKKTAVHPEYEEYSLYILTRHLLMHDYWHMYRMEELWLTRDPYLTKL